MPSAIYDMDSTVNLPRFRYHDLVFRIIASLLGAHFVVMFGEKASFTEAIVNPGYQKALLGSFIIAFALVSLIWWITTTLDKRYDWLERPLLRSVMQVGLGIGISSLLAYPFAAVYFYVRGVDISETLYWKMDYPYIVSLLTILNLYYVAHYAIRYFLWINGYGNDRKWIMEADGDRGDNAQTTGIKMSLAGGESSYSFSIDQKDISYIAVLEGNTNLYLFDRKRPYSLKTSLDKAFAMLNADHFYRVSRQWIVNCQAVRAVHPHTRGSIKLHLVAPWKKEVVVSQRHTPDFKKWFNERKVS